MDIMDWALKLLIGFLLFQYLIGPVLIWLVQKMPSEYKFRPTEHENFIEQRSQTFVDLHNQITSSSFRYVGSFDLEDSHSQVYFSIYYNDKLKLCCTLSSAYSQPSNTTQIEFTQLFSDGTLVNINNNPLFNVYPDWEVKTCYRFPNINSFQSLLYIAQKLVSSKVDSKKIDLAGC